MNNINRIISFVFRVWDSGSRGNIYVVLRRKQIIVTWYFTLAHDTASIMQSPGTSLAPPTFLIILAFYTPFPQRHLPSLLQDMSQTLSNISSSVRAVTTRSSRMARTQTPKTLQSLLSRMERRRLRAYSFLPSSDLPPP